MKPARASAFKIGPSPKEGVLHSSPTCPCLYEVVVERASTSPTVTLRSVLRKGVLGEAESVTPFHMMWRLGIQAFNPDNPRATGKFNAHFSVHSYLWAMEYYGLMAYVAKWPRTQRWPKRDGVLTPYGYRWGGTAYRPEYAFVALLSFIGWREDVVESFVARMLAQPAYVRLALLRRTAAWYLQNQENAYARNGFHSLCFDGGSGYNDFTLFI